MTVVYGSVQILENSDVGHSVISCVYTNAQLTQAEAIGLTHQVSFSLSSHFLRLGLTESGTCWFS